MHVLGCLCLFTWKTSIDILGLVMNCECTSSVNEKVQRSGKSYLFEKNVIPFIGLEKAISNLFPKRKLMPL